MKKLILFSNAIVLFLLFSCNNEEKKDENNSSDVTTSPTENINADVVTPQITSPTAEPMESQGVNPIGSSPSIPPASKATPAGMNPPHGEPGHDCGLAVGAPLNSPKDKNGNQAPMEIKMDPNSQSQEITIPTGNQPPVIQPGNAIQPQVIQSPAPPSGPTPAGMNPPHGAPGHDCAIPVGAPLKK